MSDPREIAEAWAIETCADQGVPVKVEDPRTIRKVADLIGVAQTRQRGSTR